MDHSSTTGRRPYCRRHKARRQGDREFEQWKAQHTKPCPGCSAPIEKNEGCNHMACSKCGAHFCWLCCQRFSSGTSTYDHLVTKHKGIFDYQL